MRKLRMLILLVLTVACQDLYAASLLEGVYKLTGKNRASDSKVSYQGEVTIEKVGENYRLGWRIGASQTQRGIAILEANVLSVGYMDHSGRDFGVVSYKLISDKKLEGKWAPITSQGSYGYELLEYEKSLPR